MSVVNTTVAVKSDTVINFRAKYHVAPSIICNRVLEACLKDVNFFTLMFFGDLDNFMTKNKTVIAI